jgi:hypothetical protein
MSTRNRVGIVAIIISVALGLGACSTEVSRSLPAGNAAENAKNAADAASPSAAPNQGPNSNPSGGAKGSDGGVDAPALPFVPPVAATGCADTLDVGSWNIEWFGSPEKGPTDDALQAARVRATIFGSGIDTWGFQEVVDSERFRSTIESAPGYRVIVASDPSVVGGEAFLGLDKQKLAFAYNSQTINVQSARVILRESSFAFAGRPPLEVQASYTTPDSRSVPLTFIVMHLKAGNDIDAWTRRQASVTALKSALDSRASAEAIFIIGDWNDELVRSKVRGQLSPFAALVADSKHYGFPTLAFGANGVSTMVTSNFANDQHVLSIAAAGAYVPNSATTLRLDSVFDAYGDTTSDHYPVVSKYVP